MANYTKSKYSYQVKDSNHIVSNFMKGMFYDKPIQEGCTKYNLEILREYRYYESVFGDLATFLSVISKIYWNFAKEYASDLDNDMIYQLHAMGGILSNINNSVKKQQYLVKRTCDSIKRYKINMQPVYYSFLDQIHSYNERLTNLTDNIIPEYLSYFKQGALFVDLVKESGKNLLDDFLECMSSCRGIDYSEGGTLDRAETVDNLMNNYSNTYLGHMLDVTNTNKVVLDLDKLRAFMQMKKNSNLKLQQQINVETSKLREEAIDSYGQDEFRHYLDESISDSIYGNKRKCTMLSNHEKMGGAYYVLVFYRYNRKTGNVSYKLITNEDNKYSKSFRSCRLFSRSDEDWDTMMQIKEKLESKDVTVQIEPVLINIEEYINV